MKEFCKFCGEFLSEEEDRLEGVCEACRFLIYEEEADEYDEYEER